MWIQKKGYSKKILFTDDKAGLQIQLAKIRQNEKIHFHKKKTEFFFVLKGRGTATIDNKETKIRPGSFLVIQPKQIHHVVPITKEIKVFMVKINSTPEDTYFV
ncbi:cupin domain-containing protein [Patescibacteria group bacterium]|nr:cupin domain-containing protein [Patescibacteria group bacterium]MBU1885048.1 cupin domain-containing protein [Patescibacteria group bacterium]